MLQEYNQEALRNDALITRLHRKKLIIDDPEHVSHCIKTIGYHRLSSYFDPFRSYHFSDWEFKPSITFNRIWQLYVFDRELRLLVSEALERIEVAFRTAISDMMSLRYGPHWYLDSSLFKNQNLHTSLLKQIEDICQRQDDPQIKYYYHQYHYPKFPPSWVLTENLSFGTWVNTFRNLKLLNDKKTICKTLDFHPTAIESWIDSLRYTRNLCAHHARLWNRWFVVAPKLNYLYGKNFNKERFFYAQAIIIDRLLSVISPEFNWQSKLYNLLDNNCFVPISRMGFLEKWRNDLFWENNIKN